MDELTDDELKQIVKDPENQPNQYGLTIETVRAIIRARNWARRYRRCYEGCKVVAAQMLKQRDNEEKKLIRMAYAASKGATREVCAQLCEAEARRYEEPSYAVELFMIRARECRRLAALIRAGDRVILSTDKK